MPDAGSCSIVSLAAFHPRSRVDGKEVVRRPSRWKPTVCDPVTAVGNAILSTKEAEE